MNNIIKCEYQHGIRKPIKGVTCVIWEKITEFVNKWGETPTIQELSDMFIEQPNPDTLRVNLVNFYRFYGIPYKKGDIIRGKKFKCETKL